MESRAVWHSRVSWPAVACRAALAAIMFVLHALCSSPITEIPGLTTLSVLESAGAFKTPLLWTLITAGILALAAWRQVVALATGAVAALWMAFALKCGEMLKRMLLASEYEELDDMIAEMEIFPVAWWIAGLTAAAVLIAVCLPPLLRPANKAG